MSRSRPSLKKALRWRRESGETCEIHAPRKSRSSAKLGGALLGIAFGTALIAWGVTAEFPTGQKSGIGFPGEVVTPQRPGKRIRIGTFNIHGGRGRDRKFDLNRTSEALQGLDLIGLNEVKDVPFRPNQAMILGNSLKLNWLFAPTEYCWRGEHFGSGVLSRLHINDWHRIPLEYRECVGYRNLVLLNVPLEKKTLRVIVTHIDRTGDREQQLKTVASLFAALEEPAILMGDMNTSRSDPFIKTRLDSGEWKDCVGPFLSKDPEGRIDWIFGRGIKSVTGGLIENGASDHPCLWSEIDTGD